MKARPIHVGHRAERTLYEIVDRSACRWRDRFIQALTDLRGERSPVHIDGHGPPAAKKRLKVVVGAGLRGEFGMVRQSAVQLGQLPGRQNAVGSFAEKPLELFAVDVHSSKNSANLSFKVFRA